MNDHRFSAKSDRANILLAGIRDTALKDISDLLDTHGLSLPILAGIMNRFAASLVPLPRETACKSGCAWCCHLRVGVSIPEALVIFHEINARSTADGLAFLKHRILTTSAKGDTLDEAFWRSTRCPCPFLDLEGTCQCLIYGLRPFSCRAFHSLDDAVCRRGYDQGIEIQVPCFPLYRASVDLYSSVLIQVAAQKGLASFQVGLVRALEILFQDDTASDRWLLGEDVFLSAKLADLTPA
ncbi:MAG: YkgJ family cysteine cluster protein [Desulfotignum sp.]|nr:YkgJ family cysteine cluster protein [Desulfobacteraceae bacterium]